MLRFIKLLIPERMYKSIRKKLFFYLFKKRVRHIRKNGNNLIVFISTPEHGNLGDQAIVYSQIKFFADKNLDKTIVEIPLSRYQSYLSEIKDYVLSKDLIIIDGGGNMGTLWIAGEYKIQEIIRNFPENQIIIFPQSIFYSDDNYGHSELEKSIDVYSSHKYLHICARDKNSYYFMKEVYKSNNILLVPDIVLYLDNIAFEKKRKGAIFCLRDDREKKENEALVNTIKAFLKEMEIEMHNESTVIPAAVKSFNREKILKAKWRKFAGAQIVITDRLHGMIFSVITGTPCLALDNSSGKVSGVYDLIRYLPYIYFVKDFADIKKVIEEFIKSKNYKYGKALINPYFNQLSNLIDNLTRENQHVK